MTDYPYEKFVSAFSDSFVRVLIDKEYIERISSFVTNLVEAKAEESHHQKDNRNEIKRFTTGLLGEAALEKLLGIDIIDWSIGYSGLFHRPDIPGYSVGIKTVEKGKYPVIFRNNYYPQIICIRSNYRPDLIFVCGLATPSVLNSYQDIDLILDANLKARGTKTGFYGFSHLLPVKSTNDLINYKK